jgi:hypothetical protein
VIAALQLYNVKFDVFDLGPNRSTPKYGVDLLKTWPQIGAFAAIIGR